MRKRHALIENRTTAHPARTTRFGHSALQGAFFNVTRERIRQIEAKALRKLRHPTRSRRLKPYAELT